MNNSPFLQSPVCFSTSRRPALRLLVTLLAAAGATLLFFHVVTSTPVYAAGGDPPLLLGQFFTQNDHTPSVAWGDVDGDGDLDLAVGNGFGRWAIPGQNRIYRNDSGVLTSEPVWSSSEDDVTESIAWGDVDGDGDLDLAVGNVGQPNRIYRNDTQGIIPTMVLVWSAPTAEATYSVAWGDVDGDSNLDLAVGNGCEGASAPYTCYANRVYRNDSTGGVIAMTPIWSSFEISSTQSVAWGDVDGDGTLDLAVGNGDPWRAIAQPNQVYTNTGGTLSSSTSWSSFESDETASIAWGDYDRDGHLDLASGGQPNRLYRNAGKTLSSSAIWTSTIGEASLEMVWGDYDGDGDLDLATANSSGADVRLYRNDSGTFATSATWSSAESSGATTIAWGDYDGDGAIDLAVGTLGLFNRLYHNNGGTLIASAAWSYTDANLHRSAVAWGDYDQDGDLDLMYGNEFPAASTLLFDNQYGMPSNSPVYTSTEADYVLDVAWGDYDGDGDLDLAVGNGDTQTLGDPGQPNRLYRNDDGTLTPGAVWTSDEADETYSVAWGDFDNDGDLDLAVGNQSWIDKYYSVRLYRNLGVTLTTSAVWSSGLYGRAMSIAWGDVDGDGDLDLAVGNFQQANWLYRNDGLIGDAPQMTLVWSSNEADTTYSVAWGDVDGDGDLDLAVGNRGQPNKLYRNDDGTLTSSAVWSSLDADNTYSVIWGDGDGDGDLDLAVGNRGQPNHVYRNDKGNLTTSAAWSSAEAGLTWDIAWGDVDGDGDLDLAETGSQAKRLYLNGRDGRSLPGAVPLVHVARPGPNADFYSTPAIQSGSAIPISYTLFNPMGNRVRSVRAYYSINGGGDWQPAAAAGGTITTDLDAGYTYLDNLQPDGPTFDWIDISTTGTLIPVPAFDEYVFGPYPIGFSFPFFNQTATQFWVSDNGWLSLSPQISGTLWSYDNRPLPDQGAPASIIAPFWDDLNPVAGGEVRYQSVNSNTLVVSYLGVPHYPYGGSYTFQVILRRDGSIIFQYQTMTGVLDDATVGFQNAARNIGKQVAYIEPYAEDGLAGRGLPGTPHVYNWDPGASGFFGQSDNVVFRIEAVPAITTTRNAVPGPYLYGMYAAQTFPFRVRGTQVRVISGTVPISNALVYRLPAGQSIGGDPIADRARQPFRTDGRGYLQGRGQLNEGDQLLALAPISATKSYTLYYTNGTPTIVGVDAYTVTTSGVQTLTVSADNPLILFDLDVSLEWDAHKDTAYLEQLQSNLQRASEYLYDFSNGQAALGHVNVFQNGDEWVYSHVVVQANNRLRPFAAQGGIVVTDTLDPDHDTPTDTILYSPGQVTMGSTWNRYGNPGQSLGEDWPIILAHELGHYLLFHDDTYIGLNADGFLVPISTCIGSAMGDLYSGLDNSEFIANEGYWQANCAETLAEQTLERNEWETMQLWYEWLISPTNVMSGPTTMPFDFSTVHIHDPYTPTDTLIDPTFYIDYQGGGGSSSEARAYLDRDDYVVNLGSPFGGQNRVIAHGARPGDRLCIFDRPRAQFGCETIEIGDDRLAMRQDSDWNPIVQISPINSTTLTINFTNTVPIAYPLRARIFPDLGYGEASITLILSGDVYSGTFNLTYPAMSGNVQVWVDEPATETNPRRETMVAFSIGGNPGTMRGGGGTMRGGGGTMRGGGGTMRGGGGTMRGGGAPIVSPDGQMIFFTENPIDFAVGTFFTIQGMAGLPPLPPGRTLVGQGYNLVASPGVSLPFGSVSIQYLSNDVLVAGANEEDLTLYFWDGANWTALDTVLDAYFNLASAPSQGEGVYALMASVKIPLYGPGWNLFAYSVHATQPVTAALLSIQGSYTTVYGYEPTDTTDPWKVYDTGVPTYVNDLYALEFGKGYWINVSQSITLHLQSGTSAQATGDLNAVTVPLPPATFYGAVLAGNGFAPAPGMEVTAWIDGHLCGQAQTMEVGGQVVYAVNVLAEDGGVAAGCGAPGRVVTFLVDSRLVASRTTWDISQLWEVMLQPSQHVYLPLILRAAR